MKKVLIFSPVPTHPQSAGHRKRVFGVVRELKRLGTKVGFVYLRGMNQRRDEDIVSMRREFGEDLFIPDFQEGHNGFVRGLERDCFGVDDWYDDRFSVFLSVLAREWGPDVLWVNYIALSKILVDYPGDCVRVLDTHDVFSQRQADLAAAGLSNGGWYQFSLDEESNALARASLVLAISRSDAQLLRRRNATPVLTMGHFGEIYPRERRVGEQPTVLYFGSGGEVNVATAHRLCEDIFPRVLRKVPNAQLLVAGRVCSALRATTNNVRFLGEVPSLSSVFAQSDVVCNPECAGSGVSIKNLTTLAHGVALVTTPTGARGLNIREALGMLIGESDEDLAQRLIQVLCDRPLRTRLQGEAGAFASRYFSAQKRKLWRLHQVYSTANSVVHLG